MFKQLFWLGIGVYIGIYLGPEAFKTAPVKINELGVYVLNNHIIKIDSDGNMKIFGIIDIYKNK